MAHDIIKYPTLAEKEETAAFYFQRKGFPGVIGNVIYIYIHVYIYAFEIFYSYIDISVLGAIDGSHVRIDKPMEDPESYVNRKQFFFITYSRDSQPQHEIYGCICRVSWFCP